VKYPAAPRSTSPSTTMPDVLAGLSDVERTATATALAHFLGSTGAFNRDEWVAASPANAGGGRAI
jgi:hypothetical protein